MKCAVCQLESLSPYSQSKVVREPKHDKEKADAHEERTWRMRMHTEDGKVMIPPMQFTKSLVETAQLLKMRIKGKGVATYARHFEGGVLVSMPLKLPDLAETVEGEWVHCSSTGLPGGGKRVWKCFPLIPHWAGEVTYVIFDDTIDEETFRSHLDNAGMLRGIGRFRPARGGYYGRYKAVKVSWEER